MAKDVTLLGFFSRISKEIDSATKEDKAQIATTEDVKSIINEMVTQTFLNSLAAKSKIPELVTITGKEVFLANGTPITIVEREDDVEGAKITFNGGEILVSKDAYIFGGCHDDDTFTNSSINFEGGEVAHIFGGGLHKSHTVKSRITMTGGKAKSVRGGAADQLFGTCTCSNRIYDGPIENSWAIVEDAELVLSGGVVTALVYGGGNGYSYDKTVKIAIDGDFRSEEWGLTVGGSNGYTGTGSLVMNGGYVSKIQGINRGPMDNISITVNDGKIDKLFVGGEIPFAGTPEKPNSNDAHGTFVSATCTINGGTIGEFSLGGNNYAIIEDGASCVTVVDNR